jgi:hypothetical protein
MSTVMTMKTMKIRVRIQLEFKRERRPHLISPTNILLNWARKERKLEFKNIISNDIHRKGMTNRWKKEKNNKEKNIRRIQIV